jgi:hypothetical protein
MIQVAPKGLIGGGCGNEDCGFWRSQTTFWARGIEKNPNLGWFRAVVHPEKSEQATLQRRTGTAKRMGDGLEEAGNGS